jgi:H+/gluconate symporter-like permease
MESEDKVMLGGAIALFTFLIVVFFFDYLETKEREKTKQTIYSNWSQFSEVEKQQIINNKQNHLCH